LVNHSSSGTIHGEVLNEVGNCAPEVK
jgi:hypothetical protein